jgi:hypothetical protein
MTVDVQGFRRVAEEAEANQRISHPRNYWAGVEDAPHWASRSRMSAMGGF